MSRQELWLNLAGVFALLTLTAFGWTAFHQRSQVSWNVMTGLALVMWAFYMTYQFGRRGSR